jgi:hypothetical protein
MPVNQNQLKLSGCKNPMKSYISFGWCTAHYQVMYEIDEKFSEKLNTKLKEMEAIGEMAGQKAQRYSILDEASMQAAAILAQYANLLCVVAEVPPSYALVTGGKFKEAMNKTKTLTNPVNALVAINNINKMGVKNDKLTASQLQRGKGATQLYSIAILLQQIEENKNKPEFQQNKGNIEALISMVKKSLGDIYGSDILERIERFANMGKNPSDANKRAALDFLVEIDAKAKDLNLPKEFEEQLQVLIDKQNEAEGKTQEAALIATKPVTIKLQYPDHEHTHPAEHSHDHAYMHEHNIPHSHEPVISLDNVLGQQIRQTDNNLEGENS